MSAPILLAVNPVARLVCYTIVVLLPPKSELQRVFIALSCAIFLSANSLLADPIFIGPITNGVVSISGLTEASGVVASRGNDNVLWTHNDSGNSPVIYAIDTQGRLLGTYGIPGNTDNEDITIGAGPMVNVSYIYVGDMGDNNNNRANIKVYQIPEPAVYARDYTNPVTAGLTKGARTITLTYPDGLGHNAESLFVDPVTGDLFIDTKASPGSVYTAPKSLLDTNNSIVLTFVRTINFSGATGASISPSGNEILIRGYPDPAYLWKRAVGQSISDALAGTAIAIPISGTGNGEPQGEAIGYDYYGSGYFTLSEATTQPLRYFARASSDGPIPPVEFIPAGSTWKYRDSGSDQGTAWRGTNFDDSGWSNGLAQFGYGDGDEKTAVSYGPNANDKYITTYFRKGFTATNVIWLQSLTLKMVVDDGAIVYLNGTPVVYERLTSSAAYNTRASAMPNSLQSTWHSYSLEPTLLNEGTNTIAVELHQSSVTGTNISFDLQLWGTAPAAYEPFDYSVGTALALVTNAIGNWWTAAGSGSSHAVVVGGNLSVPGLAASRGQSMQFGAVDGPSARFNLTNLVTSGTIYFSLAFKVTNLGALSAGGGWMAGFNNSRQSQTTTPTNLATRILTRAAGSGGFSIGTAKQTTDPANFVWSPTVFTTNETIFVVGRYQFNTTNLSDDVASLWINPPFTTFGAASPPAPMLTLTAGPDIGNNSPQIGSFVLLQRGLDNTNQPAVVIADELRVGFSWASVTPPGPLPPPTLGIVNSGANAILSWPTNYPAYHAEYTDSLQPVNWSVLNGIPSVSGGWYNLSITTTNAARFFRLHNP